MSSEINLIGFASGAGAGDSGTQEGPEIMHESYYLNEVMKKKNSIVWKKIISPYKSKKAFDLLQEVAVEIKQLCEDKKFFVLIGGDHSSGIGTWSGASVALKNQGSLGLIWIDAHMDSHTHDTSLSGNIHGMPLASLLGYGDLSLKTILSETPKIKPEHLCLIGVRSFEPGEAALLEKLNVRIFFMEEVKLRGLDAVLKDAIKIASHGTVGFGMSIDIDSIDPMDAPGTGTPESDGIKGQELCDSLKMLSNHPLLIGVEFAEFNPYHDKNHKTEKLIVSFIESLAC